MEKTVLITGCSTGIGRALAERLSKAGYWIAASARNVKSLEGLDVPLKLTLDVTNQESLQAAVTRVIDKFGRIDILINNAGYAQVGATEEVSITKLKAMYEVNVFGVLSLTQAVLPHMRAQGSGKIINISSIAGKLVTPVTGGYSSSKFALEALSDALRLELADVNIQVVLVEPGPVKSQFDQTASLNADRILQNPTSPYTFMYQKYQLVSDSMHANDSDPGVVAEVVLKAIQAEKPKARYMAGVSPLLKCVIALRDWVWEPAVKKLYRTEARA
jgi:NADP-dependent 3-hydroxy acid dehydrogenase YdfG